MIARAESGQARDNMPSSMRPRSARDVGELYEPLAEEKDWHSSRSAGSRRRCGGNRELVSQALANLVRQRDQICPAGSDSERRAGRDRVGAGNEDERITLTVADRGPGIPEADRGRVVELSVRLEQSRIEPGSGLGLSVASAVARLPWRRAQARGQSSVCAARSLCRARDRRGQIEAAKPRSSKKPTTRH